MEQIAIYKDEDGQAQVEVRFEKDTAWLNQYQLADLFSTDRTSITKHLNNIFKTKELDKKQTCAKFTQVQKEGNKKVARNIMHYKKQTFCIIICAISISVAVKVCMECSD